ncbi:MAG: hypothetical protein ACOY4K_09345 [Pseudomonadota bacterium]
MNGIINRLLGRKRGTSTRMGVGACEWQPPHVVQPSYELKETDRELWQAFERYAAMPLVFEDLETYVPVAGEPSTAHLKANTDFCWWSRSNGDLLILVERLFAGFPDPLTFSLLACDVAHGRLHDLGQFWVWPDTWTRAQ